MNIELIERIKSRESVIPEETNSAYELIQTAVEFYASLDTSKIAITDLTMLYRFCIIAGNSQSMLDGIIDKCNLTAEQKEVIKEICKKWNYENIGVFGSGSMKLQISKKADENAVAKRFIGMLIKISKLTNDKADEIFRIVGDELSDRISGMGAGIASQILHCLNPYIFPVLNTVGQNGFKIILGLTNLTPDIFDIKTYADNAKEIYDFRETYLKGINFKTIDAAFWEYEKFKKLLNWFVRRLKINNGILEGRAATGRGYARHKILDEYKEWRKYDEFELDCTIQGGFQKANASNYIHLESSMINIIPKFSKIEDKNDVYALQIVLKKDNNLIEREYPEKTIDELDLLNTNSPNVKLADFFQTFRKEIDKHQKKTNHDAQTKEELNSSVANKYKAENIILYGVPGSGKSFTIKKKIAKLLGGVDIDNEIKIESNYLKLVNNNPKQIVRVVFHPDYTYSDFTGQILPKTKIHIENGKERTTVDYQFTPGPFARILKSATKDSNNPYFLIIEEINRGNAAAIFGDLFQLLDRKEDCSSEYPVNNYEIGKEIQDITDDKEPKDIIIPSNLWILATMNTSDQNVFTLDTAFQRRWDMELIPNDLKSFRDGNHDFKIEGTNVNWCDFVEIINKELEGNGTITSEDKRLGVWFIKADKEEGDKNIVSRERFANKVLKYLWDDAFKFNRADLFDIDNNPTLEAVIDNFTNKGKGFKIFSKTLFAEGTDSLDGSNITEKNNG